MSKKYKLKKWYPSLPKEMPVGFEVIKDNLCNYLNPRTRFYPLASDEVENNPEFWEEIKEPEFQILEAKTSVKVSLSPENISTEIYKVLRLSDNVTFSVGDKCNLKNGNGNRNPILRFEVRNENFGLEKYRNKDRIVVFLETMHETEWGPIELDSLVKSKEPLFITEDGVDIYENDTVHWCRDFKWLYELRFVKEHLVLDFKNEYKVFSTEKAANDWIDLNKPMYSKKQIMDAALVKYTTGRILLHIKDIK